MTRRMTLLGSLTLAMGVFTVIALADEQKTGKPVRSPQMIAARVHADWCGACGKLAPQFSKLVADSKSLPVLFVTFDMTNDVTRRQAEYLASALGLAPNWSELATKVGNIILIDPENKHAVSSVASSSDLSTIVSAIRRSTAPGGR